MNKSERIEKELKYMLKKKKTSSAELACMIRKLIRASGMVTVKVLAKRTGKKESWLRQILKENPPIKAPLDQNTDSLVESLVSAESSGALHNG